MRRLNSQGLAAKDTAPGEPQPEGTARRSLRGVLFQGPVSAGGELIEAVLAVTAPMPASCASTKSSSSRRGCRSRSAARRG
ncbi:MAG: hypothetical protein COW34_00365 [Armatimonadetes bacterium CG17_big_fil_post_rev_8_21_14_2_50_66_6]|nr:MAG: hypothetical protein COW34_00365 [Armatimonadetes bacterium CG17_big_fil_post_rev_8_21_14_2_50_66_6]